MAYPFELKEWVLISSTVARNLGRGFETPLVLDQIDHLFFQGNPRSSRLEDFATGWSHLSSPQGPNHCGPPLDTDGGHQLTEKIVKGVVGAAHFVGNLQLEIGWRASLSPGAAAGLPAAANLGRVSKRDPGRCGWAHPLDPGWPYPGKNFYGSLHQSHILHNVPY